MPNSAQVEFNVIDQSFSADDKVKGISGYLGIFQRGPIGKSDEVFSSWKRFKTVYGGLMSTSDDPLMVKRALARGSKVRICRISHFSNIADSTTNTATKATLLATKVFTLASALVSGQSIVYTINSVAVTQAFDTSGLVTLQKLGVKLKALYPSIIDNVLVISSTKFQVTQLSGTGVVTTLPGSAVIEVLGQTGNIAVPTPGADGTVYALYHKPPSGSPSTLIVTYVKITANNTPTLLATAIRGTAAIGGWTLGGATTSLIAIAPTGSGASYNGYTVELRADGVAIGGSSTGTVVNGVTAVAQGPAVTSTTLTAFVDSIGNTLFTIVPKYAGADYANLRVSILSGSNGQSGYFDLKIEMSSEGDFPAESYTNLTIPGQPNVGASHYLDTIIRNTELVTITYSDLSAITAPITPVPNAARYTGGSDGGTIVDTDWIGDPASKLGLNSFDTQGDMYAIAAGNNSDAMAIAGAAYATARADVQYYHHFDNSITNLNSLLTIKDALLVNTPYIEFWMGGLNVLDELTNIRRNVSAIGDILGCQAASEIDKGPWYSFAGKRRGLINNAFGVVNNFGGSNDSTSLDLLANHQINAVVNSGGQIYLSGNFTGQLATSHLSFNGNVRLIIFIKRTLKPQMELFLEDPNDIPTWKKIYLQVKPQLDDLITPKRALFDYRWQGDQFAKSLNDLVINDATQVGLGKYKVKLFLKDITSLQWFSIDIIITDSAVSFEESLTIL